MPNPTPQEEFLLQYCNYPVQQGGYDGFGFFWDEFTKISPDYWTRQILIDDWLNQSYYAYTNNYGFVAIQYFESGRLSNQTNHEIWVAQGILRADITTVDSTHYRVNVNNITYTSNVYREYITTNPSQEAYANSFSIGIKNNAPFYSGYMRNYTPPTSFEYTAPSRESALQELVTVFHNIEIYVDGEKWTDARAITYNWQSVPSISGKNGILSLVTLDSESINDGEPVSGAAVSVFDQNPVSGNNVKDIVDGNTPLIPSAVDVTATFIISNPPVGELASRILAAKKDSIPESIEDADKTISIPANASNVTMPGLDENSQYYFAIFVADAVGDTAVSDPKDIYTSADEGWSFDYTGEIQTFTAPKTGIYQLETWGAQGGDATDGTNSARGGYGAYAVGEVFLTQGDTLYINVGGQNGYGGGGNGEISYNFLDIVKYSDISQQIYQEQTSPFNISALSEYYLTNNILCIGRPLNLNWSENLGEIIKPVDRDSDCQKNWYFPINRVTNVKKISFDIYLEDVTYEYWAFAIIWIKWVENDTMSTNSDILRIGNFGTPGTYQYFGQWKHFEIDVNVQQMDYLTISTGRDVVKIKNIIVTCST